MHGSIHIAQVLVLGFHLYLRTVHAAHYTDHWAVHILGGEERAKEAALKHGFIYKGQIMPDYYHFQHRKVAKRSAYASTHYHRPLSEDNDILWAEQQVAKSRKKRSVIGVPTDFNDPKWPLMWYLNRGDGEDMNVQKAWAMGFTGKGVVVTILDDGIEKDHPDLVSNYDENASYDVNGHDPDPSPRYEYTNENRHGTRCAGEVAAQANNHVCSVGVAFNARIGGVRMLDGDVTDSVEAQSLGLNPQHIHIYSASWGPDDDGATVDGPATLARKAFYDGITKGRGGLGSIFVWASGNGGRMYDNCNCDGYTNSIYTLSISSATENGHMPWYSESCSSTLATTYSSGSGGEKQIITTDLRQSCTETHTGTSASAPIAAGLIALALQANPSLTWRDMQHIVVETANPTPLEKHNTFNVNGAGKKVNHSFGFGLMNAAAMVTLAQNWTMVPEQRICEIRFKHTGQIVPSNGKIHVHIDSEGCKNSVNHVRYLEHVQARITMTTSRRGDVRIILVSPAKTESILLDRRTRDNSREGFNNWAFMTTHNWGERAEGRWTLRIENGVSTFRPVSLRDWVLVLYGTENPPRKSQQPWHGTSHHVKDPHLHHRRDFHRGYTNYQESRPEHPMPPMPTTTTTTTTRRPPRVENRDYPWTSHNRQRGYQPSKPSLSSSSFSSHHTVTDQRKIFDDFDVSDFDNSFSDFYASSKHHPEHTCVYETLAKKSNMSVTQYVRKKQPRLTPAELKEWTLVMKGTATHPLRRNDTKGGPGSPGTQQDQPYTCAGVTSNGICIECKPGFFKMEASCVAHCPQHYFGSVQAVQLASPIQPNSTKPLLHTQGVCKPCHDSCLTCKGPAADDCFQCTSGFEQKGDLCEKKMIWDLLDSDVMKHLAWAIILCIAAILLFCVVFGLLQARDKGRLCWRRKPTNYVPDWSKGHYDGMTPPTYTLPDGSDTEQEFTLRIKGVNTYPTHPRFSNFKYHNCHGATHHV